MIFVTKLVYELQIRITCDVKQRPSHNQVGKSVLEHSVIQLKQNVKCNKYSI